MFFFVADICGEYLSIAVERSEHLGVRIYVQSRIANAREEVIGTSQNSWRTIEGEGSEQNDWPAVHAWHERGKSVSLAYHYSLRLSVLSM